MDTKIDKNELEKGRGVPGYLRGDITQGQLIALRDELALYKTIAARLAEAMLTEHVYNALETYELNALADYQTIVRMSNHE